jgi:tryptophan synthase beta chain
MGLCENCGGPLPRGHRTHCKKPECQRARELKPDQIVVINLSGRGDKDVNQVARLLNVKL